MLLLPECTLLPSKNQILAQITKRKREREDKKLPVLGIKEEKPRQYSKDKAMLKTTLGHTHQGNQNCKRHMYPNVHRSTVYNSQDMETT